MAWGATVESLRRKMHIAGESDYWHIHYIEIDSSEQRKTGVANAEVINGNRETIFLQFFQSLAENKLIIDFGSFGDFQFQQADVDIMLGDKS